ncbi:phosphatidylinositol-specific phospholipase C/glycerophosphodiester phosphodiesterase family protein [Gemmata sp. JC673]|uniref:Altered inheritance of mitochondria protein 6 n=1 Tax=Gemmata algarum TaxID=2975278 RepID=A0ABU5EXD8_9BACT|nr:phosphatidylinositol-specific phospholipase C/glycerophosphodiester phosphodiesterase family protein [Gemmata algarum]MDY3559127.1 phosphatidylinositol-specific phospholipase C/glycerophosphodiester phosphodiesterase family protein [Gemmata algarum]
MLLGLACLALTAPVPVSPARADPAVVPLARAHAHNDYEHTRPLQDALGHGFCSVEADIWLVKGELLVGHTPFSLKPARTLEKLYLAPLRERIKAQGGAVYRNGPPFYLMIDIKTDAKETYLALAKVLEAYSDILTATKDGTAEPKAVTVVVSGNRDVKTIAAAKVRHAAIDGRPADLAGDAPAHLVPWVSESWKTLFKWDGTGAMPDAERAKLRELVAKAHKQGRKVRFWAAPETSEAWKELLAAGADFINTDKLAELATFLREAETKK